MKLANKTFFNFELLFSKEKDKQDYLKEILCNSFKVDNKVVLNARKAREVFKKYPDKQKLSSLVLKMREE
jgi:hypothetical protein